MQKFLTALAALAVVLVVFVVPAGAITNGTPDNGAHPYVGELLFYVPDEIDPRFTDPGAWFSCTGTLVSPTVLLTAGHCTFAIGLNGAATSQSGGDGGNDVWVNFQDEPNFDGFRQAATTSRMPISSATRIASTGSRIIRSGTGGHRTRIRNSIRTRFSSMMRA
jgi:hypothetical protein